jgi:hypothetical protein
MIPLRAAIPNKVVKPIIEATERNAAGKKNADHPSNQS